MTNLVEKISLFTSFPSIASLVFEDAKNYFSTPLPYTEKTSLKTLDPQQKRSEGTSFKLRIAKVRVTAPSIFRLHMIRCLSRIVYGQRVAPRWCSCSILVPNRCCIELFTLPLCSDLIAGGENRKARARQRWCRC